MIQTGVLEREITARHPSASELQLAREYQRTAINAIEKQIKPKTKIK